MGDMRKDYVLEREVIVHPTTKKNVFFESKRPKDFDKLIKTLTKCSL